MNVTNRVVLMPYGAYRYTIHGMKLHAKCNDCNAEFRNDDPQYKTEWCPRKLNNLVRTFILKQAHTCKAIQRAIDNYGWRK